MARERKKRVVLMNPDEPRAGDYAYQLYDHTHPLNGEPETVSRMRKALKGLRGEEVTLTFNGQHISEDGEKRRFSIKRTFTLNRYADVFGPGSAFASAIHYVRDKHSGDELLVHNFTIEESDFGDEDSEYDED